MWFLLMKNMRLLLDCYLYRPSMFCFEGGKIIVNGTYFLFFIIEDSPKVSMDASIQNGVVP